MSRAEKIPERITRSSEYRSIYDGGRKLVGKYYIMFYLPAGKDHPRFGITASGKIGGAVVRNRVKRRTREAVKIVLSSRSLPADIVLVALVRSAGAPYEGLVGDIKGLLSRVKL